ncbi:MAG TPA: threonine/serine exporter family protein [Blastocatellia bacterium]|nr:threonine/serine exporter family protein [Blastocatellia bacterium]
MWGFHAPARAGDEPRPRKLGVGGHFFSMPTGIIASFGSPEHHRTSLIRAQPGDVDLQKLTLLDELVTDVTSGKVDAAQGAQRVDDIVAAPPRYGVLATTICFGLVSGAASRFFSGGWREALAATAIGLVLGALSIALKRKEDSRRVFEPVASMIAALLAVVLAQYVSPLSIYITTMAGLIVLVPGLTLTTAMTELATRELVSGTARLMGAVVIFLEIGFGVALGWQARRLLHVPLALTPSQLPEWTLAVALVISALSLSVLLRAQVRDFVWILLAGAIGVVGFRSGAFLLGPELGSFLGALLVGMTGNLYARTLNRPSAVPTVPGIMLLVPGSIGFGSLSRFIERDVVSAVETAFHLSLVAVALVTGLMLANLLSPPRRAL